MARLSWRHLAQKAINQAIADAPKNSDLITVIDAAYPFGARKNHPYKVWLDERKKALNRLNLYKAPGQDKRLCKWHPNDQTCLICMNKK